MRWSIEQAVLVVFVLLDLRGWLPVRLLYTLNQKETTPLSHNTFVYGYFLLLYFMYCILFVCSVSKTTTNDHEN